MQRNSVVLPQPLGPTMHSVSRSRTSRSSWRNAVTAPSRNSLLALAATMTDAVDGSAVIVRRVCNKFLLSLPGNCVMPLGAVKAATLYPMERRGGSK